MSRSNHLTVVAVALVACVASAEEVTVVAEGPQPAPTWDLAAEGQLGFSLQRLGMLADLKLRAKRQLYLSDSEFFKDNFVNVALTTQVAPNLAHAGVQVDVQPASFLKLSGGYHFVGYFGTLGTLRQPTNCTGLSRLAATDTRCDFHPIGLEDNPAGIGSTGHRLWAEATLMGRVGPVIAVGTLRAERWMMNSPGQYWVNELYGLAQARSDTVITGGGALLYAVMDAEGRRPELLVGAADDLGWSLATDSFYNRVGPVASLRAPKWGPFREATAQLAVLFYTHERYLVGSPYVALALSAATPNFLGR
jgi:hypothetical protein